MRTRIRAMSGSFLICILFLNGFVGVAPLTIEVEAQNRVIIINAEQPNIWTLEQAHYLLAQMHRRNLDLKAKSLEDLDPNEINGLRFDILRTLVELGVKFDQADLASNRLLSRNQNFNTERRQALLARRDKLRSESLQLTEEISQLEIEKARATVQADKDRLTAEIAAKTTQRDKVDKEIEFTNSELGTLTAPSGNLKSTEAEVEFDPEKLPKSTFDDAFKDAAKKQIEQFSNAPKLNATLKLENFLEMQYEIIAKQLTLLRDEVGPGERLLFLELPQTINVTHHEANKKWAQSWWKIAGYTTITPCKTVEGKFQAVPCRDVDGTIKKVVNPPIKVAKVVAANDIRPVADDESQDGRKPKERVGSNPTKILSTLDKTDAIALALKNPGSSSNSMKYFSLDQDPFELSMWDAKKKMNRPVPLERRDVRTIEVIPRQSSLNVSDMNLRVRSGAFSFVASFLFGFGSRLNVQRQREQFSQFVQQELYSSGFGKGSREFGWTFTPMPGTDRLQSGVRTTYAVVVVPKVANSIILESNGCYFPRSQYQPNNYDDTTDEDRWGDTRTSRGCSKSKAFIVPIPSSEDADEEFLVRSISYMPVAKGERITVSITGYSFSAQMGVLVNGFPLNHSIGLAQLLLRDDSKAGAAALLDAKNGKIQGSIERISSEQLVISFQMPDDFKGTPTITLVAPGKALTLNWLRLDINGYADQTLLSNRVNMFGTVPVPEEFRIDKVEVFRIGNGNLSALVYGGGFHIPPPAIAAAAAAAPPPPPQTSVQQLYINGVPRTGIRAVSPGLIEVSSFPIPGDDTIQVTLVSATDTIKSQPVVNPAYPKVTKVSVVSYEAGNEKKPGVLVVRIEGTGFPEGLTSNAANVKVVVTSSTEAYLTITDPKATEVVTLNHPTVAGLSVNVVVTRKAPPKQE